MGYWQYVETVYCLLLTQNIFILTSSTQPEFSDQTMECEEKLKFYAHKIILNNRKTVFLELYLSLRHTNPLIYTRGVKCSKIYQLLFSPKS